MFYIGITAGRLVSGLFTIRFSDRQMIRFGMALVGCGVCALFLPLNVDVTLAGLILIGIGCAPIYPCIIHSTPDISGADKSQAMIGVQMAACCVGVFTMPPLFGFIASAVDASIYPVYLAVILVLMIVMYEKLVRKR
ncbi:MAG: MFS transporter [Bulleidia sp.]